MKLIAFSKHFKEKQPAELAAIAHQRGLDGWDLCVRPGYPVSPANAAATLVQTKRMFEAEGLDIPMVTGNFDLLAIDNPTARPLLAAMDTAGIRALKLGYWSFDPWKKDYWREVDRIRFALDGWQQLARQHNIRICYHTHSERCMGMDAGMIMHLLRGFDPRYIGAYIDPAHLLVEGEEFAVALAIVGQYLSLIALKDVLITREDKDGHGKAKLNWVGAPAGMVDWTTVLGDLARVAYDGPMSVHCEFVQANDQQFMEKVTKEIAFFRMITGKFWPLKTPQ
jgi:sugar phosphate isomerase/epimerase